MPPAVLPVEEIVAQPADCEGAPGRRIGRSREGRDLFGHVLGRGPGRVSLIGGCHADEPVGPAMLRKLVRYLSSLPGAAPPLQTHTWYIVPHVNPDGAVRNGSWTQTNLPSVDHLGVEDRVYDLALFVRDHVREPPGDDIEFGFPRGPEDRGARPENRAVARFLAAGAPFLLHGSFHGMGFAPGPWFLVEPAWIDRTVPLRNALRARVRRMGYQLLDADRHGEKGFRRIDEGFSTRPDSAAMATHFQERGDPDTAAKFRPSSMEFIRGLGGDPFTLVSEMPLFLLPAEPGPEKPRDDGSESRRGILDWLERLTSGKDSGQLRAEAQAAGFRGMPIRDQMRLQLAFLNEALAVVGA